MKLNMQVSAFTTFWQIFFLTLLAMVRVEVLIPIMVVEMTWRMFLQSSFLQLSTNICHLQLVTEAMQQTVYMLRGRRGTETCIKVIGHGEGGGGG